MSKSVAPRNLKRRLITLRFKIKFIFVWYDLWIGTYIDRRNHYVYILPLPCVGVCIWWYRLPLFYIKGESDDRYN